jgi:hypothetical protein
LLVVVDQVDIKGITILETEGDAPVSRNRHAPVASSVTPEPVKTIPWHIEISRHSGTIQMGQDALNITVRGSTGSSLPEGRMGRLSEECSTMRNASIVYGPVRTVVREGRGREAFPYPDS